ncbi:hypothetical protein AYO20_01020 [Fonsecaea nubica]|uniref:Splicing factor subunit n=1 Tax=Fonsecaea nubica TaxID=856822 RepID=A0A178DEI0_9EURO|nr:hypothetical protein AYO20_01020 [Fonsecaea nubica]OAL39623.1 hypothetical protein AYO20_01020 [Fonsecaea nubica]
MADKLRTLQQLESLQAKYVGTGHADTTRYEWSQNIVRDSLASYVGHPPLLAYMALGLGENKEIPEQPGAQLPKSRSAYRLGAALGKRIPFPKIRVRNTDTLWGLMTEHDSSTDRSQISNKTVFAVS